MPSTSAAPLQLPVADGAQLLGATARTSPCRCPSRTTSVTSWPSAANLAIVPPAKNSMSSPCASKTRTRFMGAILRAVAERAAPLRIQPASAISRSEVDRARAAASPRRLVEHRDAGLVAALVERVLRHDVADVVVRVARDEQVRDARRRPGSRAPVSTKNSPGSPRIDAAGAEAIAWTSGMGVARLAAHLDRARRRCARSGSASICSMTRRVASTSPAASASRCALQIGHARVVRTRAARAGAAARDVAAQRRGCAARSARRT